MNLLNNIRTHDNNHFYSFHTPGHKGKQIAYSPLLADDITELEDTDDLHNPNGVIAASMQLAAELYHSKATFFSTNGSTAANMAAIDAVTEINDTILVCGQAHISVQNISILKNLKNITILPKPIYDKHPNLQSGVAIKDIEKELKANTDIKAVFITSPTYEGILSDIEGIADLTHQYKIPLIVDEAHGAHLALSNYFPKSALHLGADLVINSLHKTLPALTGTSLLHVSKGSIIDEEKVNKSLLRLLSTSPSYLLLASIDSCLHFIKEEKEKLFCKLNNNLSNFYSKLSSMKQLKLLTIHSTNHTIQDKSRIVILCNTDRLNGHSLYRILRNKYKIEMEKSTDTYVIGISSIADTEHDLNILSDALLEIDKNIYEGYYYDSYF